MFDFDSLREVGSTINKNKMRTALTGVAVAWGILLLVVLLGAGAGLQHGMDRCLIKECHQTEISLLIIRTTS